MDVFARTPSLPDRIHLLHTTNPSPDAPCPRDSPELKPQDA